MKSFSNGDKVELTLVGKDGNAFAILAIFRKAAKDQGFSADEINQVVTDAMSDDYNHLLFTIMNHCEDEVEAEDKAEDESAEAYDFPEEHE